MSAEDRERFTFIIHRCKECGAIRKSIGSLHAHIDAKHRGWGPFNIIPPINPTFGHYPSLMKYTVVINVLDYEVVSSGREESGL